MDSDVQARIAHVEDVALEVAMEIWANMPWGHEFVLANGVKARLVEFNNGAGRSRPKMVNGRMRMLFDVVMENGNLDHIEFSITRTGFGGMA